MVKAISNPQSLQVHNVSAQERLRCGKRPKHQLLWHSTCSSQSQIVLGNVFLKAPCCHFTHWWCQEISDSPQNGPLSLWLSGKWPCLNHMENLAKQAPFFCSVSAVRIFRLEIAWSLFWVIVPGCSCTEASLTCVHERSSRSWIKNSSVLGGPKDFSLLAANSLNKHKMSFPLCWHLLLSFFHAYDIVSLLICSL